jgi:hypothetical protein
VLASTRGTARRSARSVSSSMGCIGVQTVFG